MKMCYYIPYKRGGVKTDTAEKYIATLVFKNRIYQYEGQQFEDFFVEIMQKAESRFQPIKANGNIGDRKNDGFIKEDGVYYQIFAPEEITKAKTIYDAVKKLEEDFGKLFAYWNEISPIKEYYFVINDKYRGIPEPILTRVIELEKKEEYQGIKIQAFSANDLYDRFNQLDDDKKREVVGYIPDEILPILEYEALHETVTYLMNIELPIGYEDNLVVPDFDNKIEFNHLSKVVNDELVMGSYQEGALKKYFNENPGVKEILQEKFHALYEQAKSEILETDDNYADCRFYYILEKACPKMTIPIKTSVVILMAYYFSSCDIFEEP